MESEMNDLFDTPAFKLVRRDDPDTSHDAAESLPVNDMERIVADTIAKFGATGAISDQIVDALPHLRYSTITARYKQLKEKGIICVDDRKQKAESGRQQHIMWHKDFYREQAND
jgi:predicted transcriptional regulator